MRDPLVFAITGNLGHILVLAKDGTPRYVNTLCLLNKELCAPRTWDSRAQKHREVQRSRMAARNERRRLRRKSKA